MSSARRSWRRSRPSTMPAPGWRPPVRRPASSRPSPRAPCSRRPRARAPRRPSRGSAARRSGRGRRRRSASARTPYRRWSRPSWASSGSSRSGSPNVRATPPAAHGRAGRAARPSRPGTAPAGAAPRRTAWRRSGSTTMSARSLSRRRLSSIRPISSSLSTGRRPQRGPGAGVLRRAAPMAARLRPGRPICPIPWRVTRAGLDPTARAADDRGMRARPAATAALVLASRRRAPGRRRGGLRRHPAPPWHHLPRLPRQQLLARRRARPAVHSAQRGSGSSHMSPDPRLHPDFGPSYGEQPVPYGIPVTVVGGDHAEGQRVLRLRRRERRRRLPARQTTPRSRAAATPDGDRHADRRRHAAPAGSTRPVDRPTSAGSRWTAGSGATWRLTSNKLRPQGWTSADAAGLPILPGLLRYGEVRSRPGRPRDPVHHRRHRPRHVWPARHDAGSVSRPGLPADGRPLPAQGLVPGQLLPRGHAGPCCAR